MRGRQNCLRFQSLLTLVLLVIGLTGCDHFFGNDKQEKEPLVLAEQGLSCVRTVGVDVEGFFRGDDKDPVRILDCISGALQKFSENTRGANPDGWTRGEMGSFFETYFKVEAASRREGAVSGRTVKRTAGYAAQASATPAPEGEVVSPYDGDWVAQARRRSIVAELFRWKAALVGGSDQTLSKDEMKRIRSVLADVRGPLAEWRGFGHLLAMKNKGPLGGPVKADPRLVDRLTKSMRSVADIVASQMDKSLWDERGEGVVRLPMKVQSAVASLEQAGMKPLEGQERRDLMEVLKAVFIGGDRTQVEGDEWPEVLRQGTEVWIAFIRIKFGVLSQPTAYDRDIDLADATLNDVIKVAARLVKRQHGVIPISMLRELMVQLERNKLLPTVVKAKSVNEVMPTILSKVFAGNWHPHQDDLKQGLQMVHLDRIQSILSDWLEGQRVAIAVAGPTGNVSVLEAKRQITMFNSGTGLNELSSTVRDARAQMLDLILRGRPLVEDRQNRHLILPEDQISGYRQIDLENLNTARVILATAMKAYAHDVGRTGTFPTLNENEVQELFADFKNMGRDLGMVDVRSTDSGIRTFMEANVFLSVSDGDEVVSLHEGVEWYTIVLKAGLLADRIHETLAGESLGGQSCAVGPIDIFGKKRIRVECFRQYGLRVLRRYFSHLPNVEKALETAMETEYSTRYFIADMERAARPIGETDLPMESSEFRVLSPILHYAESLYSRYDADRSGLLEQPEVWGIYPVVVPFLKKLAGDIPDIEGLRQALFSWLILTGRCPERTWFEGAQVFVHITGRGAYRETATVPRIVQVLASFQKVGRDNKNTRLKKYYEQNQLTWENRLVKGDRRVLEETRTILNCTPDADSELYRLLVARKAEVFAPLDNWRQSSRSSTFADRIKGVVQADPQLQLLCLAF